MPVTTAVQSEDSADDLPLAQYLRKFLQKDAPQHDLTKHVTEFRLHPIARSSGDVGRSQRDRWRAQHGVTTKVS